MNTIRQLVTKLKKAHDIYIKCSNEKQIKIMEALEFVFKELEAQGVERSFSESLLIYGKEFVDSVKNPIEPSKIITIPTNQNYNHPNQPTIERELKNPIKPTPATIEDAEKIFGVKAENMTDKEKREFVLAEKYNALAWESLPATPGKVKIRVLQERGGGKK